VITVEEGLGRLRSDNGSPNNVGLYLGRALPLLVAYGLMGRERLRRRAYLAALLVIIPALLLSFSRGAFFLGIPAALATVLLLWGGRRVLVPLGALAAVGIAGLAALLRLPALAERFSLGGATTFFRINLWQSTIAMIRDHLLLGVGPDNFLYQYRGHYIRPEAWQEPSLSHPHNLILDFWSRLGVLGLAVGVWLQLGFWRTALIAWRGLRDPNRRALAAGLMGSVAAMLAHGLVDNSLFLVDLAYVFMLSLGAIQWLAGEIGEGA
jgi:O-antigen ligase